MKGCRRVLVAVDSSPAGERALARAIATAVETNALLTVIATTPSERMLTWCGVGGAPPVNREQLRQDGIEHAERVLARAREQVPPDVLLTTRIVFDCGARRALLDEARTGCHTVVVAGAPCGGRLWQLAARRALRRLERSGVQVVAA